jgi:general stress protein YciG
MGGTKEGGLLAASKNKRQYGHDFYARIGALGGKKSRGGGFKVGSPLARIAGAKGGAISKRRKAA